MSDSTSMAREDSVLNRDGDDLSSVTHVQSVEHVGECHTPDTDANAGADVDVEGCEDAGRSGILDWHNSFYETSQDMQSIIASEVAKTDSFFATDEPDNVVHGFMRMNYNIVKGIASGAAVIATAPFLDASQRAEEAYHYGYEVSGGGGEAGGTDGQNTEVTATEVASEFGGVALGFAGAVAGFGTGIVRGKSFACHYYRCMMLVVS